MPRFPFVSRPCPVISLIRLPDTLRSPRARTNGLTETPAGPTTDDGMGILSGLRSRFGSARRKYSAAQANYGSPMPHIVEVLPERAYQKPGLACELAEDDRAVAVRVRSVGIL